MTSTDLTNLKTPNWAVSKQAVWIVCVIYLAAYSSGIYWHNEIRYLMYAIPLILLAYLLYERTPGTNVPAEAGLLTFILVGVIWLLAGAKDSGFFWSDFIIILLIILSFVPKISVSLTQIRVVFLYSVAWLVLCYALTADRGLRLFQILQSGAAEAAGRGFDDGGGALICPIYSVFFYAIGTKIELFLAIIMSILGGKRIGFAALIVGIVATYLFRRLAILQKRRNRVLTLLIALALINVTALNLGTIAEYTYSDADVERVMQGRYAAANELQRVMKNRSWLESITGSGPGSALALIDRSSGMTHPHNDWLKVSFDYGILGSTLLLIFMASIFSSSRTGPGIALATGVIMMTDNVIVYLWYWLPIVLMLAYSPQRDLGLKQEARNYRKTKITGGPARFPAA
jgi:hypothetical protein